MAIAKPAKKKEKRPHNKKSTATLLAMLFYCKN